MIATSPPPVSLLPTELLGGWMLPPRLLGAAVDFAVGQHTVAGNADQPIRLGYPGSCPPGGTTVAIVLDESASVTTGGGNDPLSRRHIEAALAIRHVAGACRCGRDRISLVPFDIGSTGYIAPQRLTAHGVRRLDKGLQRLAGGWGLSSQLGPALDHVEAHARRQGEGAAVVVFSDFLLTDPNPSSVLARLTAFPGHVHAVVLGAQPPAVLVGDPNVTVTRLTPTSPSGSAARAVFDALTSYRLRHTSNPGSAAHHHQTPDDEGELIA